VDHKVPKRPGASAGDASGFSAESPAETALRESEQRFRDFAETASDWLWETDAEHRFTFHSHNSVAVNGMGPAAWRGRRREEAVAEAVPPGTLEGHLADLAAHRPFRNFAYWAETPRGRICVSVSGNPVFDANGRFRGYRGTGADITERMRAEEQREMLTAELDHRVKNILAVVQALAQQSLTGSPDDQAAFLTRLAAFGRTHALLAESRWQGARLREVLESALSAFALGEGMTRVRLAGPDLTLNAAMAPNLGMAFHELATNAAKYGALSAPRGRIEVVWQVEARSAERILALTWRETGGPTVTAPTNHGFGVRFIERLLTYSLGGTAKLHFLAEGLHASFELPLR